jgi:hypothetical protein
VFCRGARTIQGLHSSCTTLDTYDFNTQGRDYLTFRVQYILYGLYIQGVPCVMGHPVYIVR